MSEAEVMNTKVLRRSASVLVPALVLTVLTLNGCMVGPNYIRPQTTAPAGWAGVAKASTGQTSVVTARESDLTQWWRQFNDPTMTALVEESVKANLDIKNAEARLRQARASRGVAVGGLLPSVDAPGAYQRVRNCGESDDKNLYKPG